MPTDLDTRIPPQALDAEMAVLGSMLLDKDALTDAVEILRPEHFYKEAHQVIFSAIKDLSVTRPWILLPWSKSSNAKKR